jgi:drug/metabolite transporter (DMT)-like permease
MDRGLAIAALAGLGGMLGWGLADFFAKKTIDRIGDTVSLVWAHVAGSVVLLVLTIPALFLARSQFELPADWHTWLGLGLFGALQSAVYLFAYAAFAKGQVAVLSPVFASYSGLVALVSIAVLGEATTRVRVLVLVALFAGVLLLNLDAKALIERRFQFARVAGFWQIAVAALLATIWTLGWNGFVAGHDGIAYASFMYLFMTLTLLAYALVQRVPLGFRDSSVWPSLVLIGLCEVGAYAAITLGFATTGHTSVVALVSGAFSLPTIVLARIFLREHVSALQTIGSAVVIAGVAALALV